MAHGLLDARLLAGTWLNWMEETLLSEMEDGRRRSLAGTDGEMALARGRDARWPRGIVAGAVEADDCCEGCDLVECRCRAGECCWW
ncbi:hypothetical protein ACLOJK_018834, partial [Asimina triloba]